MTHRRRHRGARGRLANRRLAHQSLEDRRLLATITVTSLADVEASDGQVTLREAIEAANTNTSVDGSVAGEAGPTVDTIEFQSDLRGTIILQGRRLEIRDDLILAGLGADVLTIDAMGNSQVIFTTGTETDVTIDSLKLRQGLGDRGGGVENFNARVTISNSEISGSLSRSFGAGIANGSAGRMTVVDSLIRNNFSVTQSYTSGGGVANFGKITIARTTIEANTAQAGGGVLNFQGEATITDSTISGNTAFEFGGGAENLFGKLEIVNSTISGNTATMGGGIYNQGTPLLTVTNSTIVGNRADYQGLGVGSGGGLFTDASASAGSSHLFNTIVAGNVVGTSQVANDIDGKDLESDSANNVTGDPTTSGGLVEGVLGNLVGDGIGGPLPLSELLDPLLSDNGGSTRTHALVDSGRAINAGNNALATTGGADGLPGTGDSGEAALSHDQRGTPFTRIVNGTVDIGAIESRSGFVADLEIDLQVDNLNPTEGESIGLTITVTNNGPNDATSVVVRNPVPAGLVLLSSDSPSFDLATGRWTAGDINEGDSATLRFVARVESSDPIVNVARIESSDQADDDLLNNRQSIIIDATPQGLIFDFGDAPTAAQSGRANDYPVVLAQDGARHLTGTLLLGSLIDSEADGMPDNVAGQDGSGGDDNHDRADEDGIVLTTSIIASSTGPTTSSLFAFSSGSGLLDGWLDLNHDGDWTDPGEQIVSGANVSPGRNLISYRISPGANSGTTFARFRLSSTGGLSPTGAADDGEVEDYVFALADGGNQSDATVGLPSGSADIQVSHGRLVVREGQTEVFATPTSSVGTVEVRSSMADDTISIDFSGGSGSPLLLKGFAGQNQLLVHSGMVDLSTTGNITAEKFSSIDATDLRPSTIKIDAVSVSTLSPSNNVLAISGAFSDDVVFRDATDWRLTSTKTVGNQFIRVTTNQIGGQVVEINTPAAWRNPIEHADVNNDGKVSAGDALRIINELTKRDFSNATTETLDDPRTHVPWPGIYFDQSGDGKATALDALRVINRLQEIVSSGEGEAIVVAQQFADLSKFSSFVRAANPSSRTTVGISTSSGDFDTPMPLARSSDAPVNAPAVVLTASAPPTVDATWSSRVDELLSELLSQESLSSQTLVDAMLQARRR